MVKPRNTGKKLTGGGASALGFGVSVSTSPVATDRDVVQALITILEDRRALTVPRRREFSDHVTISILSIREQITDALQHLDGDGPSAVCLRAMRAACRRYLDTIGGGGAYNEIAFGVALGELRAAFGGQLRVLDNMFKLRMEPQLREILPLEDKGR